ncbi:MAG: hypothetical protein AABW79_03700 [Nanoarchaeota archaeon]
MESKGQAAMEFLMTYGWAILAAIIAIGVLAYFGVFSPGKYTPSATVVNPPFYATGATVSELNGISVELRNNGGEDLTVTSMNIVGCGTSDALLTWAITAGSSAVVPVDCAPALVSGDNFKGDATITYTKSGSSLSLQSTGTIAQKVTA